ncbi:MAG: ATP-binding protein [bacterium]
MLGELEQEACKALYKALTGKIAGSRATMFRAFRTRGLVWRDDETSGFFPTAAGVVFLGKDPAMKYLQCQVLADVYADTKVTAKPRAQTKLSAPIPQLIEELIAFVHDHTEHPTRVVGVNNIELDEYPRKAIREALVNAFAHRDYADASRKVRVEVFRDRLVVSSPGYPPKPLTLARLRQGRCESCRRNPVLAECLASLHMMEQRGTGFERIRAAMLDHGLDAHQLDQRDGYFKVLLLGPNGNFDRLRTPGDIQGLIPPSVEAALNERQKGIMIHVQTEGGVTSGWCLKTFGITYNTAYLDLSGLVRKKLLVQEGKGRATHYRLAKAGE